VLAFCGVGAVTTNIFLRKLRLSGQGRTPIHCQRSSGSRSAYPSTSLATAEEA
jgi:hypothetical protein